MPTLRERFFLIARRFINHWRNRRYFRGPGALRATDVIRDDIAIAPMQAGDIAALDLYLPGGDTRKHADRLQAQAERLVTYLIATAPLRDRGTGERAPIGHLLVVWAGEKDLPDGGSRSRPPLIEDVFVHPAVRHSGVGRMLMDAAESCVRQAGHCRVGLTVALTNPGVESMYRKRGYVGTDFGVFESRRTFTDANGQKREWSQKVHYLVKPLEGGRDV